MIKKVIGINGSPRREWNTYLMVRKCLDGAKCAGAKVKLYQISDFKNVKPCNSCFICKLKNREYEGKCAIKDDLEPLLNEIKEADALVVGSPIYWGNISSAVHPFLERLLSSNYSYNKDRKSVFGKKIKTGLLFTMNVDQNTSQKIYQPMFDHFRMLMAFIFGDCEVLTAYNTLQFDDYSKYDANSFDVNKKHKDRKESFPKELKEAYELGKRLVS